MKIITANHSFQKTVKLTDHKTQTRYHKTQTPYHKRQEKVDQKQLLAVHSVSVSKELTLVVSKTQTVIQSAGRIMHHLQQWGALTSDPHI